MTNKELILDSLIDDDEAFTQIVEYFDLAAEINISPVEIKMLLEEMYIGGANIVKLAVMPKKKQDVLDVLAVTSEFQEENPSTPVITMSMGDMGVISRLCGESFGSCVTFAAHKQASAPGQMALEDVSEILQMIHNSISK